MSGKGDKKQVVPVEIQGREYKIRAETSPAAVRAAALLLNETMERVRERAGTVDSVDVAVLAALNIANSLVAERESATSTDWLAPRIEELGALIESALADPPATH